MRPTVPKASIRPPAPRLKATEVIGRKSNNRGGNPNEDLSVEVDVPDLISPEEPEPGPLRRWWMNLSQAAVSDPAGSPEDDLDLKPTTMRRPEPLYGYVVALELIFISILNLTVTHGKGAPAHPATTWSVIGLLISIGLIPIIRFTNHRLIVAFYTVAATFFATQPRTPSSLAITHFLALGIAIVYAFCAQSAPAQGRLRPGPFGPIRVGRSRGNAFVASEGAGPQRCPAGPPGEERPGRAPGQRPLHAAQGQAARSLKPPAGSPAPLR